MAEPAAGPGLSGDLHRRDHRQDPRRAGRQPADLRGHRGHRATGNATSSACGPATAARARSSGCRCSPRSRTAASRRVHRGLRRPQRPARRDQHGLAADDRADLHRSPAPQHLPLRLPPGLGRDRPGPQAGLHRRRPRPRAGPGSTSSPRSGASAYPAIIRLWENAWAEFVPFLDFDAEIRKIICTTNAIESLNARYRRAVRARGHFPNEQAALKCLYLVTRSLDPTGSGRARWTTRWKPA